MLPPPCRWLLVSTLFRGAAGLEPVHPERIHASLEQRHPQKPLAGEAHEEAPDGEARGGHATYARQHGAGRPDQVDAAAVVSPGGESTFVEARREPDDCDETKVKACDASDEECIAAAGCRVDPDSPPAQLSEEEVAAKADATESKDEVKEKLDKGEAFIKHCGGLVNAANEKGEAEYCGEKPGCKKEVESCKEVLSRASAEEDTIEANALQQKAAIESAKADNAHAKLGKDAAVAVAVFGVAILLA